MSEMSKMRIRLGRLKQGNHSFYIESAENILARKLAGKRINMTFDRKGWCLQLCTE